MSKLIYCMMTQNRLSEVQHCVEAALPYVDHIVIVDGGSIDDSIWFFRNWSEQEPKIHFYIHPWSDDFSAQRTKYLRHADEFAGPGDYVLVSDPDEWFEETTFKNLRKVCNKLDSTPYTAAGFQCKSVSMKGPEIVHTNIDNYWKHLLYKWTPGLHYVGNPHETIVIPSGFTMVNTPFFYWHVKQQNVIWERGFRNLYHGGGGPNLGRSNPKWLQLKRLVVEVYGKELTWHEFQKEMLVGDLPPPIKDWLIMAKDETGYDGASEHRESYKTYFRIYHPEEEPAEFVGTHIE